ncbi:MAG: ATP-dependent Clp protease proteolytic subunit [Verrucomicrobiota bacterium]
MTTDHYRENPLRAIHVLGIITPDLLGRLTPQITRLRADPVAPITVYIDSPGGSTQVLDSLERLLRAPDQNENTRLLTTAVTNRAASAAADLLIAGDYAIAFPGAIIHYHGTRTSADGLTVEDAQLMAGHLRYANERFALRLAQRIISRLLFLLTAHRSEIDENPGHVRLDSPVAVLVELLQRRLSKISPDFAEWVKAARDYQNETGGLVRELIETVFPTTESAPVEPRRHVEARLAKALLDLELKRKSLPDDWTLSDGGWEEFQRHFFQVIDFIDGEHRRYQSLLLSTYGSMLLTKDELAEYRTMETEPEKASPWLKEKAGDRMSNFWYFVVCLCRRLQTGENEMSAEAAYWLGLVDEVLGSGLPCMRQVIESRRPSSSS